MRLRVVYEVKNLSFGVVARTELSMGPFCVTRSNPTHQLTDPTQPKPLQVKNFGPNPIQLTNLTASCNQMLSNRALNALT